MALAALPFRSTIADYQRQADDLFTGWQSGAAEAIDVFRTKHPRCLDDKILWLSKDQSDDEERDCRVLAELDNKKTFFVKKDGGSFTRRCSRCLT